FLLFYIPVTTYLTDFDINGNSFNAELNRMFVTVFYIPSYFFISVLIGIGMIALLVFFKNAKYRLLVASISLFLPAMVFTANINRSGMRGFHFTDQYLTNLFLAAEKDAVIFTQIDFYYFPTLYYQYVLDREREVQVIDQPLLKRSWYLEMLQHNYPSLIDRSKTAVLKFLNAVKPFENDQPYDGNYIENQYIAMINSLIDESVKSGKTVYFTYIPASNILRNYSIEPVIGAYKLTREPTLTKIDYEGFDLEDYKHVSHNDPFLVRTFSHFYGEQHVSRGAYLEQTGKKNEALQYYRKGLDFYFQNEQVKQYAIQRIRILSSENQ
ncbi:MAG: hypothetical protein KDC05_14445, partial [Bacteroidales bacterium]|nr:hypothetical protein [Bacteroidales bacterium]